MPDIESSGKVKIPLTEDVYQNVPEEVLTHLSPRQVDAYVDEAKAMRKRPGLKSWVDLGTGAPVDGVYWWNEQRVLIAVSAGRVWKITDKAGTKTEIAGDNLNDASLASFATTGPNLIMANGGRMVHTTVDGSLEYMASDSAPERVDDVAFLDKYILANNVGTQQFNHSNVDSFDIWGGAGFFSAEAQPDSLVALRVGWREILLVGPRSAEVWWNDGVTPFSRKEGFYVEYGTAAGQTVRAADNTWMWLGQGGDFIRLEGRTPKIISGAISKTIASFDNITDATAYVSNQGGRHFYICHFPSAIRTFVYDLAGDKWTEFGYWDSDSGDWERYLGRCGCYSMNWNMHLVGSRVDGNIYEADPKTYQDDSADIRVYRRTGHMDHGTRDRKRCNEMRIVAKRGAGSVAGSEPQLMIRWRSDNGPWRREVRKSMGKIGENEFEIVLKRLGIYRSRQYEIAYTGDSDLVIVRAEADVDLLT